MIDIENEIFTEIATKLRSEFEGIFVSGEYVKSPSSFPAVSIVEFSNVVYRNTMDTHGEVHDRLTYEVNVYSNRATGKKSEAKAIVKTIDSVFVGKGFTRRVMSVIPNQQDSTIYRITARYSAIVSKEQTIYRS